eukprot:gene419-biopygen21129
MARHCIEGLGKEAGAAVPGRSQISLRRPAPQSTPARRGSAHGGGRELTAPRRLNANRGGMCSDGWRQSLLRTPATDKTCAISMKWELPLIPWARCPLAGGTGHIRATPTPSRAKKIAYSRRHARAMPAPVSCSRWGFAENRAFFGVRIPGTSAR